MGPSGRRAVRLICAAFASTSGVAARRRRLPPASHARRLRRGGARRPRRSRHRPRRGCRALDGRLPRLRAVAAGAGSGSARSCSATRARLPTPPARATTVWRWPSRWSASSRWSPIVEPMVARLLSPRARPRRTSSDPVRGRIRRCTPAGIAFAQRAMAARPDSTELLAASRPHAGRSPAAQDAIIPTPEFVPLLTESRARARRARLRPPQQSRAPSAFNAALARVPGPGDNAS